LGSRAPKAIAFSGSPASDSESLFVRTRNQERNPTLAISSLQGYAQSGLTIKTHILPAIALLAAGTIPATGFGRVLYQKALTVTDNNNGFVSIFFLLIPAFTCLLSLWMSRWISELKFTVGALFFLDLGLIAAPILVFLWQSQKGSSDRSAIQEMDMQPNISVSDRV
jgi:hypothetical protein